MSAQIDNISPFILRTKARVYNNKQVKFQTFFAGLPYASQFWCRIGAIFRCWGASEQLVSDSLSFWFIIINSVGSSVWVGIYHIFLSFVT
jgi:hypothetical protein